MIDIALNCLRVELENYLRIRQNQSSTLPKVQLGSLVDPTAGGLAFDRDMLAMTMVHLQEERLLKNAPPVTQQTRSGKISHRNPDIKLMLYLMFAANFKRYSDSLSLISQVIAFFQMKATFDASNTPSLVAPLEKMATDMLFMDFEQLNLLWGTLGTSYLPSVVYKIRLVPIRDEAIQGEKPIVNKVDIVGAGRGGLS